MKLNSTTSLILTGFLVAGLSGCGSGSSVETVAESTATTAAPTVSTTQTPITTTTTAKLNFIDKNANGLKDAGEVYDANHNDIDDATECLGGDDDHNGRIEGAEKHHNDSDHDGVDDDNDDDHKGVKGQCKNNDNEDDNDDNDNDNDNDDNKRKLNKK